jgi:crotonobetainyl-CoA:carnitine CoA-transferase CaiB-like acyl-CoA transferase
MVASPRIPSRSAASRSLAGPPPLAGVVVVALEQAVAGPFATRQLADLGARVVKIERREGDFARGYDRTVHGLASHFVWLNRGKQSIELDVKQPSGRKVLDALVDRADVFVQNLSPAAAERRGVTARQLTRTRPRLIACDISGYGGGGPYSARKAYDLLIQCETGLVSISGTPGAPAKAGISIADIAAGMYAYTGILSALYQRKDTGSGQAIEVSMLEALGEWMGYPYLYSRYGGTDPPRAGASHATIAPYGPVRTGTGETITLGLQNQREWDAFCRLVLRRADLIADPRFADNAARVAHRTVLDRLIAEAFSARTYENIRRDLDHANIAHAQQRTVAEFCDHPQLRARNRWRTVRTPNGDVEALLPPVTASSWQPVMGPVPRIGEHTGDILAWLGLPDA